MMPPRLDTHALRVLVAAGDRYALDHATETLAQNGFAVLRAADDASALERWRRDGPDVILVDVALPSIGGFEFCRYVRQTSRTPVILVASEAVESDVVRGFAAGADDFIVQPFGTQQLSWRIRAIHGRYVNTRVPVGVSDPTVGDLTLDLDQHALVRGTARAQLTPTEFRIFRDLAANQGTLVSVSRLLEVAQSDQRRRPAGEDALRTHVAHLRRKLRTLGGQPRQISVVPGKGYLLPGAPTRPAEAPAGASSHSGPGD